MQPGVHAGADGRHRRRLREDLGVRADADFEVLAPHALLDHHRLEPRRLLRARLELREIVPDEPRDLGPDRRRRVRIAARALLDDALEHRDDEGDAGRLDGLQVDRREKPGLAAVARIRRRVGEDLLERSHPLALGVRERRGGIVLLAEVAHSREGARHVEHAARADRRDRGPLELGPPDAPRQRPGGAVGRKNLGDRVFQAGHAVSSARAFAGLSAPHSPAAVKGRLLSARGRRPIIRAGSVARGVAYPPRRTGGREQQRPPRSRRGNDCREAFAMRVQLHRFEDLAKPKKAPELPDPARRAFLATATSLAAVTAMAPEAFARNFGRGAPAAALSRPRHRRRSTSASSRSSATRRSSGSTPARCGPRGRPGAASGATCCGATSRTTRTCATSRRTTTSRGASAIRPGTRNGNTFDYEGRQIACQHGTRKVVRYEHNGKTTVLAEKFEGQEFNAPNDAVVHPNDGSIWFTDPGYGSLMEYEGNRLPSSATSPQPLRKEAIYRIDKSGADHQGRRRALQAERPVLLARLPAACTSPTPASRTTRRRRASSGSTTSTGDKLKNPKTFVDMTMERQDRLRRRHPLRRGRQCLVERRLGRRRL